MRKWLLLSLVLLVLYSITVCGASDLFEEHDQHNNLRLGNDYIVIVTNIDENGEGRFAIETTGGAPFKPSDDNKPLVYGRPKPWTSYTTLRIDDINYVFGGKTERRAGKAGKYGEIIESPQVVNGSVQTATRFGDLIVKQILSFVKSSTTGLFDTVQIKYRVENTGQQEHDLGLRIMLDTMLGSNDGAPFRIGQDAVTTDKLYFKHEFPVFWQAFDSISNPQVTSQGTLKGQGVTLPDKVHYSDWGSLADGVWDFDFNPGQEFIRKGEYETDSAIAMYWEPETIKPGEVVTYVTNYGLGGITIVPGLISLGVTSPAEVIFKTRDMSFPIIAYIENTSEITARDVKVKLNLPPSLTVDNNVEVLGDLQPGDISQLIWQVRPSSSQVPAKIDYNVRVEAENTDSNQVSREIRFVGPPNLQTRIGLLDQLEVSLGELEPNPFKVEAEISNTGGSSLYDVSTELVLPPGLIPASREVEKKYLGYLQPGESVKVHWQVKALQVSGNLPFAVDVKGLNDYNKTAIEQIKLPELKPLVYLEQKKTGDYIIVDIIGTNLQEIDSLNMIINYEPAGVEPVYVSRGNIFLKDDRLLPWSEPNLSREGIIKFVEELPTQVSQGTLASIHFKVKKGEAGIEWGETIFTDTVGSQVEVNIKGLKNY